ncbi:terminase small subunit [Deinococcus actinosclerus]|nr:terminase small subunit [Deinococcus actinosclerus]
MQPDAKTQPTAEELGAALTDKHRMFVEHYFRLNFNSSAASRATGYADHRQGWRILQRPDVQAYIQARMAQYMPADEVMQRLTALARTDGSQFLKEEAYEVPVFEARPLQEKIDLVNARIGQMNRIDPGMLKARIEAAQAEIAELEVQLALDPDATYQKQVGTETRTRIIPSLETAAENGVLFAVESVEYTQHGLKFKRQDPIKALELIGKHHKLFTEKVEHSGEGGGPVQVQITRTIVGGNS